MKKTIFSLTLWLLCAPFTLAQMMKVVQGQVTTLVPAASAGDITFSNSGKTLTVMGNAFQVGNISQIVIDETAVSESTLAVNYAGSTATVTVSADVAPLLKISVNGAHVRVVADASLAQEVTYLLTGTSTNGSFYMDGSYKSTITLENLTLTNPDSAAVCIDNGKRIQVNVPTGTTTTLADGTTHAKKACFFINGHAEFMGGGTLNVSSNTKHAYASDEYTCLKSGFGTFNITSSANDGLHIDQYLQMDGGTLNIAGCKGDCIDVSATKDATDENNGQIILNGGNLSMDITAEDVKGMKAESNVTIANGTISANVAGNGTKGISVGGNLLVGGADNSNPVITMNVSGTTYHKGQTDESKCRGIKVKGNYTLNGGTISMNVTGKKAKGISIDGTYTYVKGTSNVQPE